MNLKELTNAEFNKYTDSFYESSIYQTSEYGFIMNNQNYNSLFLGLTDENDNILGATLILIEKKGGFKYAYAPKGFLINYSDNILVEEFTKKVKEYLNKNKIIAIKINPMIVKSSYNYINNSVIDDPSFNDKLDFLKSIGYYHLGFNNLFESFKPRFEAVLDINKPINKLFSEIDKNFRSKIKNADKNGIRIYRGNENELDFLYEQVKNKYPRDKKYFIDVYSFFKKRNMIEYYYAKINTNIYLMNVQRRYQKQNEKCAKINNKLFNNLGKNNNKLINSKIYEENKLNEIKNELIYATNLLKDNPNGIIIATMLIAKYKKQVYIYMDGFNKDFKKFNAKHLMTWKLIEKYAQEGYHKFSLGGLTNPSATNSKYKGLNEFKLKFNANCIEYIGDLELITNIPLYTIYRNSKPLRIILKREK